MSQEVPSAYLFAQSQTTANSLYTMISVDSRPDINRSSRTREPTCIGSKRIHNSDWVSPNPCNTILNYSKYGVTTWIMIFTYRSEQMVYNVITILHFCNWSYLFLSFMPTTCLPPSRLCELNSWWINIVAINIGFGARCFLQCDVPI